MLPQFSKFSIASCYREVNLVADWLSNMLVMLDQGSIFLDENNLIGIELQLSIMRSLAQVFVQLAGALIWNTLKRGLSSLHG